MFFEELDYWLLKMPLQEWHFCGLEVIKWPKKYTRLNDQPWKYVWTTLDFAHLEIRRTKVKIDRNNPFIVAGSFGGKFAVFGNAELEERKIVEAFETNSKIWNDGASICLTSDTKIRRLSPSQKRDLKGTVVADSEHCRGENASSANEGLVERAVSDPPLHMDM